MIKKKKGFSLVECLVAFLIISIVSVSAFTTIRTSNNYIRNNWNKYCAEIMADNALACFQGSDNNTAFATKFSDGTACGNGGQNAVTQSSTAEYYNRTFQAGTSSGLQFDSIVATESSKEIKFLNGTDEALALTDNSSYSNYVHDNADSLDKLTSVYSKTPSTNNSITVDIISGHAAQINTYKAFSSLQYIIGTDGVEIYSRKSTMNQGNREIKDITNLEITPVERHFLDNNQFLCFNYNSFEEDGKIYLAVFQITNENGVYKYSQAKEDDQYQVIH